MYIYMKSLQLFLSLPFLSKYFFFFPLNLQVLLYSISLPNLTGRGVVTKLLLSCLPGKTTTD